MVNPMAGSRWISGKGSVYDPPRRAEQEKSEWQSRDLMSAQE
jgi:hypothetical protein